MDQNNYVQEGANGYDVIVDGQYRGTYGDRGEAEQMYNYTRGGPALYEPGGYYANTPVTVAGRPSGGYQAPSGGGLFGGMEYFNQGAKALELQAAYQQAMLAYQQKRMEMIDLPMSQLQKDQLAYQAFQGAATQALQAAGIQGNMAIAGANMLMQAANQGGQLAGMGQNAYQGAINAAGQFGQGAAGLTQNAYGQATQGGQGAAGLYQGSIGQAGSMAGAGQNAIQQAAALGSQEALRALELQASLRGPRNAFQQQALLHGLNEQGISRGVDAISGKYDVAGFQAPQANPEAASLGTMAADMRGAGGPGGGGRALSPSEIAMRSAQAYAQRANQLGDTGMQAAQGWGDEARYYGQAGIDSALGWAGTAAGLGQAGIAGARDLQGQLRQYADSGTAAANAAQPKFDQAANLGLWTAQQSGNFANTLPRGDYTPSQGQQINSALDYIWQNRPDLGNFYNQQDQWKDKVNTPEGRREIVRNWLGMSGDTEGAGRDAMRYAQQLGMPKQQPGQQPYQFGQMPNGYQAPSMGSSDLIYGGGPNMNTPIYGQGGQPRGVPMAPGQQADFGGMQSDYGWQKQQANGGYTVPGGQPYGGPWQSSGQGQGIEQGIPSQYAGRDQDEPVYGGFAGGIGGARGVPTSYGQAQLQMQGRPSPQAPYGGGAMNQTLQQIQAVRNDPMQPGMRPRPLPPQGMPQVQQQGFRVPSPPTGPDTNAYLKALPNPNKIVGRQWAKLPQSSRDFMLSGYGAKGFDENDVQETVKRGLPGFRAPGRGRVA